MNNIKELLEEEVSKRNCKSELSEDKLDPIIVAKEYNDEYVSLICALFAYGNAKLIVKFLRSLNFSLLNESEEVIEKELLGKYYRFQNSNDVINLFITLKRLKNIDSLNNFFLKGYNKENNILDGISTLLEKFYEINKYTSRGYTFLLGKIPNKKSVSAYKRWNMYFRWMVRHDNIDMGLWEGVSKSDLLLPLDTHTFHVSQRLGLLQRKTYDLKAVYEITNKLKEFDISDPIKYDFALYRIGQEKIR